MSEGIVLGGVTYPLGGMADEVDVLTWRDHGVEFRAGDGHNRRRVKPITLAVWHWTAAENPPLAMARTLRKRELGVEFAIDRDGTVFQFCDPLVVDTADAGIVNARSVGVEIVSYGMRRASRLWTIPKRGKDRGHRDVTIHGKRVRVASFYPAQTAAACALADVLSTVLPIPARVPMDAKGAVLTRALSRMELDEFSGHLGHYHVTKKKLDPGPVLIEDLWHRLWRKPEYAV